MPQFRQVAAERDEACGEGAVGYAIGGEARGGARTRLEFCTVGVGLGRGFASEI